MSNNIENYLWTTGTSTAYVVNSNSLSVFSGGQLFFVKIHIKNTGSSTLDINGTGPRLIKKNGSNLIAGDLILNSLVVFRYVASADNFEIDRVENFVQDTPLESAQVASALGLTELELSYLEGVESNIQDQIDALGGASAPSGTGFVKVTSGVYDTPGPLSATEIRGLVTGSAASGKAITDDGASGLAWAGPFEPAITTLAKSKGGFGASIASVADGVLKFVSGVLTSVAQLGMAQGGTGVDLSASGGTGKVLCQDASHVISARSLVPGDIPRKDVLLATLAGNQTGMSGSGTTIAWDTVGSNESTRWANSGGTFTLQSGFDGRYLVVGQFNSGTSVTNSSGKLQKNGTNFNGTNFAASYVGGSYTGVFGAFRVVDFVAGDTLRAQLSGDATMSCSASNSFLQATYLGRSS